MRDREGDSGKESERERWSWGGTRDIEAKRN